jgi:acyl-CoA synthetase (NDP forming)
MVYYVDVHDGDPEAVLDAISAVSDEQPKPVVAAVVRSDGRRPPRTGPRVPNYMFPETCANVLARAAERREWLSRPLGQVPDYQDLDGSTARTLIASFLEGQPTGGLAIPRRGRRSAGHAWDPYDPLSSLPRCRPRSRGRDRNRRSRRAQGGPSRPCAASDIDAVLRGLDGEAALRSGWRELEQRVHATGREWAGAIVQPMVAPGGADVLVGAVADPDLGPVVAVALGGRQAGLSLTAAFRLIPATDAEADELIDSSDSVATELDGFRGSALLDRQALRELILRFSLLLREAPEVVEADLNPVRCMTSGCVVLDMRLRIEHRRPVERIKTW